MAASDALDQSLLSIVKGDVSKTFLNMTIGSAFDRAVDAYDDHVAIVVTHQAVSWSFRELAHHVDALAIGLFGLGLVKGDRIGLWAPNRVEWIVTQYATAKLGLVLVNLNPAYRTSELEFALGKAGCRALILADSFKTSDYIGMLRSVIPELAGSVPGQLKSKRFPYLENIIHLGVHDEPGMLRYDEIARPASITDILQLREIGRTLDIDDPINIQFTSGTTGTPKGATLSHRNLINIAFFTADLCGISIADSICVPLPLYHVFAMALGSLLAMVSGAKAVYPGEAFQAESVLQAIEKERCTSLYGVPTMFIAMLASPNFDNFDVTSLRTGIIAGSSVPEKLMREVISEMHMQQVVIGYGMTETSSTIMMTFPTDPVEIRVKTVGHAAPHVEVKVVDERGTTVARGETGEMCVRGFSVMLGYWDEPELTRNAIDRDGWFRTGDLGTIDDQGNGRIVGRLKDLIIRGGENISPTEIEALIHQHPSIELVQVVGVPDSKYGEELCACVRLKPASKLTLDELKEFCRDRISHFKIPRYLRIIETFPMTSNGKIQKHLLSAESRADLGLS